MEPSLPLHILLTKFSNCSNILPYYGHLPDIYHLLQSFSIQTRDLWHKNRLAFNVKLQEQRKNFRIFEGVFTKEIGDFLVEKDRYMRYFLEVKLRGSESFKAFKAFLERIELKDFLRIKRVEITVSYRDVTE